MINFIIVIDDGIDFIDVIIIGMGCGVGNLKMELLFIYFNKYYGLNVDFNVFGNIIIIFILLFEKY